MTVGGTNGSSSEGGASALAVPRRVDAGGAAREGRRDDEPAPRVVADAQLAWETAAS